MRRTILGTCAAYGLLQGCSFGYESLPDEDVASGGTDQGGDGGEGGRGPGSGGGGGTGGFIDPACEGWLDDAYSYRRKVTFQNLSADEALDDFTALVVLTASTFNYARTAPFGVDLRFFDALSGEVLPHHIDTWNEGSISTIWVRVPEIAATDSDHIFLFYGGPESATEDASASFDADYAAVWHLSESSAPLTDSTDAAIELDFLGGGAGSLGVPGRIGLGIELDGAVDGANSSGGELLGVESATITAWVRPEGGGDQQHAVLSIEAPEAPLAGPNIVVDRDSLQIGTWVDGSYRFSETVENQLLAGEWGFVALRVSASSTSGLVEMKVNGGAWETVFSGDTSSVAVAPLAVVSLGHQESTSETKFPGRIDEVQISGRLRSDGWVDAQYRSQANLNFLTLGPEDTCD